MDDGRKISNGNLGVGTWGADGRRPERGERGVWPGRRPRGKVDGEARIAAREEVWPYRGPRGMDDSRKI